MSKSIVLPNNGLIEALVLVMANDIPSIGKSVVIEDVPETLKGSVRGISKIGSAIKNTAIDARTNGVKVAAKSVGSATVDFGKTVYTFPKKAYKNTSFALREFRAYLNEIEDNREKAQLIIKLATCLTSTAGGAYLGNQLPDQDIKVWGIGKHRDFLFHSVIAAASITVLAKFLSRIFNRASEYMHPEHPDGELLRFITLNLNLLAFGTAIGVAVHLGVDGTIQGHKAIHNPLGGTFVPGTLLDDNIYLLLNAILSGESSRDLWADIRKGNK